MSNNITKATVATVKLGDLEIEGLLLPDGSYVIGKKQPCHTYPEYWYRDGLHILLSGECESRIDNTPLRTDLELDKCVIEVKNGKDFTNAIGQVLHYSYLLNKSPVIAFFGDAKVSEVATANELGITCINVDRCYKKDDNINKKSNKACENVTERMIGTSEVWNLINAAKEGRNHLLLKTCYLLGLRAHEVVKLRWDDITPSGNGYKIRIVGKNAKLAFLPIDKNLVEELKQISTSGYIFQSRKRKGKLSTVSLHRIIKESAIAAGLSDQISAHWLRHQRCFDLVKSGKFTLSQVQTFMRHSSSNITDTYIHIDNEVGSISKKTPKKR